MIEHLKIKTPRPAGSKLLGGVGLGCILLAGCAFYIQLHGQQPLPNRIDQPSHNPFDASADRERDPLFAARQLRALNTERQKSMVSDTDKLLKLAQELNQEVETGNSTALTAGQLRKIADIEKLARNVKQKMSISYSGGPTFEDPISHPMH